MNYIQWNTEKLQLQTGVLDTKEKTILVWYYTPISYLSIRRSAELFDVTKQQIGRNDLVRSKQNHSVTRQRRVTRRSDSENELFTTTSSTTFMQCAPAAIVFGEKTQNTGHMPLTVSRWTTSVKFFRACQRMAKVPNSVEILPKISTGWIGCMSVTVRYTTDRQRTGDSRRSELNTVVIGRKTEIGHTPIKKQWTMVKHSR